MKAVYLSRKSDATSLEYGDLPQPPVRDDEILVKVHAAAIMPAELEFPSTFLTATGGPRPFPVVLGHQFSGVIESIGPKVHSLKVGEPVYGLNDWFGNGAQAELCIARADSVAHKPRLIDHVQASVLPMPALAAWQGLFELSHLQCGQRVLIHGTAAGAGIIAVQLARWRGARVTATASDKNQAFVQLLGAETVIDDRTACFDAAVQNADVVLDCVGSKALERSCRILKAGGRFVTIAGYGADAADHRAWVSRMGHRSALSHLAQIGKLIDAGDIQVFVDSVYPLSHTRQAYARSARSRRVGDVAVRMVDGLG